MSEHTPLPQRIHSLDYIVMAAKWRDNLIKFTHADMMDSCMGDAIRDVAQLVSHIDAIQQSETDLLALAKALIEAEPREIVTTYNAIHLGCAFCKVVGDPIEHTPTCLITLARAAVAQCEEVSA
jgi:hypothetical protein